MVVEAKKNGREKKTFGRRPPTMAEIAKGVLTGITELSKKVDKRADDLNRALLFSGFTPEECPKVFEDQVTQHGHTYDRITYRPKVWDSIKAKKFEDFVDTYLKGVTAKADEKTHTLNVAIQLL